MKIDLFKLEGPLRFDETVAVGPDRIDSELVTAPLSVRLKGEVHPHDESFTIVGSSSSEGSLACARCLEVVPWQESEDFTVRYRRPSSGSLEDEIGLEEDDLDVAFFNEGELDLGELAAEQAILALPMRCLCDPNCAGLCARCGANLNRAGACACEPEVDPRWGALADLAGDRRES